MNVWDAIDLRKHAVIEASAGTGKTYTIERLVARLLVDREDLTIDQLLIVTFTEKAAGELKDRVRTLLEERERTVEDEGVRQRIQTALDGFDRAAISTIHSFCQRVLREYAFENDQTMDLELVDETDLRRSILQKVLRQPEIAKCIQRTANPLSDNGIADIITGAEQVLTGYRGPDLDLLDEQHDGDIRREVENRLPQVFDAVRAIVPAEGDTLCSRYDALNMNARTRTARRGIVEAVDHWLERPENSHSLSAFEAFRAACRANKYFCKDGFACVFPTQWTAKGDNLQAVFPALPRLIQVLHEQVSPLWELLDKERFQAHVQVVRETYRRVQEEKERRGLFTYNDMIHRVWQALQPGAPGAEALQGVLRTRYRVAIVDEFQDTDVVQWNIFRRLFVDDAREHTLIMVGDPKQSIYAFRGADVRSYLAAKKTLLAHGAEKYDLTETYRCAPGLVQAFNALFKGEHWFPEKKGIPYTDVAYPDKGGCLPLTIQGENEACPLINVHIGVHSKATAAQKEMGRFIVEEVKRLLAQAGSIALPSIKGGSNDRPLVAGDLCVLVESKHHARAIEAGFKEAGIPHTFYKKPGLYESNEALHLSVMLHFLATPNNEIAMRKALISRFLKVEPGALFTHEGLADPALRSQLDQWLVYCEKRQWGPLFDSLLYDTGLWCRIASEPDGDRQLTNYRQLFDELLDHDGADVADICDLATRLSRLRTRRSDSPEGDVHQKESEQSKVQIMTMHAAKGLEFPIVFIADGFTDTDLRMRGNKSYRYTELDDGASGSVPVRHITFDAQQQQKKARAQQEEMEGRKRLYYVALTRARQRLYLPWVADNEAKWVEKCVLGTLLLPGIQQCPEAIMQTVVAQESEGGRTALPSPAAANTRSANPAVPLYRLPSVAGRRLFVDSFSSLKQHTHATAEWAGTLSVADEEGTRANDEPALAPEEATGAEDSVPVYSTTLLSLLPKGTESGLAFHDIMEALCHPEPGQPGFETLGSLQTVEDLYQHAGLMTRVDDAMTKHRLPNRKHLNRNGAVEWETRRELAVMIWRALRTTLPELNAPLCALGPHQRKAELEFYMSESAAVLGTHAASQRQGLFTGFIDLLLRHGEKFYILDWKTNALDAYDKPSIQTAMQEADYHLQYQLYSLATLEWLRQSVTNFRDDQFGGALYLFVRGGGHDPDGSPGVFFEQYTTDKLDAYQRSVGEHLRRCSSGLPLEGVMGGRV